MINRRTDKNLKIKPVEELVGEELRNIIVSPIEGETTGVLVSINKRGRNKFDQNDLALQKYLTSATGNLLNRLREEESRILSENSFRSIINLTKDLSKFHELDEFTLELTKRAQELFKVDTAKILLCDKTSEDLVEFFKEDNLIRRLQHNSSGSLAKEVIKTATHKFLIKRVAGCAYNETVDLATELPIICLPILNPLIELHSEYLPTKLIEGTPNKVVLGVLQIINPRAITMEYNLILKRAELEILSQFLEHASYNLTSILSN